MRKRLRGIWALVLKTATGFTNDNCFMLAGALAYYALFSLAPLLVILTSALSLVGGSQEAVDLIYRYVTEYMGSQAAETVHRLVENAYQPTRSLRASLIGLGVLAVTATTMLIYLQTAMNIVWGVYEHKKSGILRMLWDRLLGFLLILLIGLLVLLLTVAQTIMVAAYGYLAQWLPMETLGLLDMMQQALSFLGLVLLTTLIFKVLPDARVAWRDVAVGSLVTAVLLSFGKMAVGQILGHSGLTGMYGPASAIIIVLMWIYYSSLIFFLGVEFTQAWAEAYGTAIRSPWEHEKEAENQAG